MRLGLAVGVVLALAGTAEAATFHFRNSTSSVGGTTYRDLSLSAGSSTVEGYAESTSTQFRSAAGGGGTALQWITCPLDGTGSLSGTLTIHAKEATVACNAGLRFRAWRYTGGAEGAVVTGVKGTELPLTTTAQTWSVGLGGSYAAGDRVVIRLYIDAAGGALTNCGSPDATLSFASATFDSTLAITGVTCQGATPTPTKTVTPTPTPTPTVTSVTPTPTLSATPTPTATTTALTPTPTATLTASPTATPQPTPTAAVGVGTILPEDLRADNLGERQDGWCPTYSLEGGLFHWAPCGGAPLLIFRDDLVNLDADILYYLGG